MDTVQLLFRTRAAKKGEDLLDKVQGYLAALLHNGQIVGDHTPMAKVNAGLLVTASLPEADALADRFANKWVRQRLRELAAVGVDRPKVKRLGTDPESREPCRCRKRPFPGERFAHDQLSRFDSECQRMDESWPARSRRRCAFPCTTTSRNTVACCPTWRLMCGWACDLAGISTVGGAPSTVT